MKSNQRWTRAGIGIMVAALTALVPAGIGAVSAGAALPGALSGAVTVTPPPWEPDNNDDFGGIDFYNAAGQQISGGSITDAPLAAYAVAEHTSTGATLATLFGYLPKNGQSSALGTGFVNSFQGEVLSDSTAFPNSSAVPGIAALSNPVVTGLPTDETLQALMASRANTDTSTDGFAGMYQLRIKLSSPAGTVAGYASTDIQISGNSWTQVYGSFTSSVTGGSGATATSSLVTASPASPQNAGTPVTFTATLTPSSAVGAVQFMDNGSAFGSAATVTGGVATSAATSALTAGSHSITAVFTPADAGAFVASTSTAITYVVNAGGGSGAVSTNTVVTASPASPQNAGTPVTFTATLTPSSAVGAVQFMDNGSAFGSAATVTGGVATSAATSALTAGSHSITAVFTPADAGAFVASTSTAITYVVNAGGGSGAVSTNTVVTASPASPQNAGTPVTFTATMTPSSAVGAVQFMDNGSAFGSAATVTGGVATSAATSALTAGSHSITAVFTPADAGAFAASTSTAITYTVNASGATHTTTALAVSPASPTTAGTSVTFTATLAPQAAAGSVQFKDGQSNLGNAVAVGSNGTAVLTTTTLPQGSHQISAVFTPTDATVYTASTSATLTYQVNQSLTALTTTTALAVSPATTAATGSVVTLTATVTCAATCTPAGSVTFWDGGSIQVGSAALVSGSASTTTSTLSIGSTHSFVAIFTPTDQTAFATSQSAAVPYNITSTDSGTATLTSSTGADLGPNPNLTPGESVTVVAGGFTAGETVSATVHSVPQTLTPATASSTGTISYVLVVPADLPAGAHSLVLAGATSNHTVTIDFTVGAMSPVTDPTTTAGTASLPFTGSDVELMSVIAAMCMMVGFVVRMRGRERRRVAAHARSGPRHAR